MWADVCTYSSSSLPFPVGTVALGYERPMLPLLGLSDASVLLGGSTSRNMTACEHVLFENGIAV